VRETQTHEVSVLSASNKSRDLLFTVTPRFDQDSQCIGIFGVFHDITERKAVEQALQESEGRFRRISELISDYAYVFHIDAEGTWTREWVTDAFTRITGYTPEEVDERGGWFSLIHPEDQTLFVQHQQSLLSNTKVITEYRIVTRHQDVFWLRDYGYPVWSEPLGRVVQVFGAAQDISERKRAELQTQLLWRRLEFLLTASPTVLYTASLEQGVQLTFVSENVQKILGYTPYEILRDPSFWKEQVHPDDTKGVMQKMNQVAATGHLTYEYRVRHRDGTFLWLRDELTVAQYDDGQPVEVIGSWSNITARKQAEEERRHLEAQLHQAQRLEALGTLAGGIAHDFNNILGTMLGYTDLLLETIPRDVQEHMFLERVHRAGKRAKDLVQQILAFSRTHEYQPLEPTTLAPIIEEALQFIRATIPMNITLDYHAQPDCPQVLANATQIHQVIVNLCLNAAHAMKSQGGLLEVTLEEARYSVDQRQILGLTKGEYVKITIKDDGCGMPPEVRERIFEPFFTTKSIGEGTGLGLSVVHGIVKSHHGVIAVDSEPEHGTRFRIFFPIIAPDTVPSQRASSQKAENFFEDRGRDSILVVDDEPALVKLYEIALTKRGYRVSSLTSSIEALELFRRQPSTFDLMLVDQDMPDLTGIQLSDQVLRERPDMPIILITGYSADVSEEYLTTIGIRHWFMKPVNANDLIQAIRKILAEK
jgi:PAS domain S-box-containing protein